MICSFVHFINVRLDPPEVFVKPSTIVANEGDRVFLDVSYQSNPSKLDRVTWYVCHVLETIKI